MSERAATRWRCPSCGYDGLKTGEWKSPIEVSVLLFCPLCHTAMDRLDTLGEIEAQLRGGEPGTFEELIEPGGAV